MLSFLVCYGTGEGQTAKVADRVVATLHDRGHEATAVDLTGDEPVPAVGEFDAVLVGASIHVGRHQPAVGEFVRGHRDALVARPTAFFQLSMSSATDDEDARAEAAGYADGFLEATDWDPDRVALFGGALRYSKYGFLKRLVMKRIARTATGDTDASRDYEYTDWDAVDTFAAAFAAVAEERLGETPPPEPTLGEEST